MDHEDLLHIYWERMEQVWIVQAVGETT